MCCIVLNLKAPASLMCGLSVVWVVVSYTWFMMQVLEGSVWTCGIVFGGGDGVGRHGFESQAGLSNQNA